MNEGVKILIERMKTNPEEFIAEAHYGATKWGTLIQEYRPYIDKEDLEVFDAAHKATVFTAMQERFTQKIMKELLAPEEDDSLGKWYTGQRTGTSLGTSTPVRSSGLVLTSNGNGGVVWANSVQESEHAKQREQMEQMKIHLEAHRAALKAQEDKKHETLYGKLKNYLHSDT